MRLFKTVAGLRAYLQHRGRQRSTGLVPTMGALHPGHARSIERAVSENDQVVVSIFVNPLQFGPAEDFQQYPRQLERDCQLCQQLGVAAVFAPTASELGIPKGGGSPSASMTAIVPPPSMASVLCGASRPGHFQGVATLVLKLFDIVQPETAYFGEKDAQQLAIIRRLVADLNVPTDIRACPTVREPSGLAFSSRNQYLSPAEREQALGLFRSLKEAQRAFREGERESCQLIGLVRQGLDRTPEVRVEYVELVDPQTLAPLKRIEGSGLLAVAVRVGSTRLIDNAILRQRQPIITIDGPAGAGKSTVTRQVAQALNLLYLDSGAMYRAVTWLAMESGIDLEDEGGIAELISGVTIELIAAPYPCPTQVKIDGRDVTEAIRTPEVTANVSQVAAQAAVRRLLVKQQQRYGKGGGIVAEGRDMGTKVFPDADLKIFLTASVPERARRRWHDLRSQGQEGIDLEQLQHDIQQRDYLDSHRPIAPLCKAAGAIEIDTDGLTVEEVTDKIVQLLPKTATN